MVQDFNYQKAVDGLMKQGSGYDKEDAMRIAGAIAVDKVKRGVARGERLRRAGLSKRKSKGRQRKPRSSAKSK